MSVPYRTAMIEAPAVSRQGSTDAVVPKWSGSRARKDSIAFGDLRPARIRAGPARRAKRLRRESPCRPRILTASHRGVRQKQKSQDRFRTEIRLRHYNPRTEEAYVAWVRQYIFVHLHSPPQPGPLGVVGCCRHYLNFSRIGRLHGAFRASFRFDCGSLGA